MARWHSDRWLAAARIALRRRLGRRALRPPTARAVHGARRTEPTRPLSPRSCRGTDRWCWASAGSSWAITITPRTPSRRSSLSWHARPGRSAIPTCLAPGCMASHSARPALLAADRSPTTGPRKNGRSEMPSRQSRPGRRSGDARARAGRGAPSRDRPFAGRIPRAGRAVLLRGPDPRRGGAPAAMAAGTLRSRLARAREKLRRGLSRRGFAPLTAAPGSGAGPDPPGVRSHPFCAIPRPGPRSASRPVMPPEDLCRLPRWRWPRRSSRPCSRHKFEARCAVALAS